MAEKKKYIRIKGACEHNLKNIDIDIPRDEFTVITGLSGSGKSSLAFDTIYAEKVYGVIVFLCQTVFRTNGKTPGGEH